MNNMYKIISAMKDQNDQITLNVLLRGIFNEQGLDQPKIDVVYNRADLIDHLDGTEYDFILSDQQLLQNGSSSVIDIRELQLGKPFYIISSESQLDAIAAWADGYITKKEGEPSRRELEKAILKHLK